MDESASVPVKIVPSKKIIITGTAKKGMLGPHVCVVDIGISSLCLLLSNYSSWCSEGLLLLCLFSILRID